MKIVNYHKVHHIKKLIQLSLIFLLCSQTNSLAQNSSNKDQKNINNNQSKIIDFNKIRQEAEKEFNFDVEITDEYRENIISYKIWRLNYIKRAYNWQSYIKLAIFLLVAIILLSGLYFSYLQFKHSIIKIQNSEINNITETKLRLGKGEIEISSSIIGLIILIFSVVFFYLYLEKVFPIQSYDSQNFKTFEEDKNE